MKISKGSSANYYPKNKERLQNELVKGIKIFLKKKEIKNNNGCERHKDLPEGENRKLVKQSKNVIKHRKMKMLHK